MSEDDITDITPQEAVREHEAGSLHCCTPNRWRDIQDRFSPVAHPWLVGHVGKFVTDEFRLICIDTEGLTEDQQNIVLTNFYGTKGEEEPGVMMIAGESQTAHMLYEAKERGQRKKRR